MFTTWIPRDGFVNRLLTAALAALLLFAVVALTPGATPAARAQAAPNPGSCDANILFVLDSSGSMENAGLNAVESAVGDFVDELAKPVASGGAPDSGISAVHFSNTAVLQFATYQNVVTDGAVLKSYVAPGGAYRSFPHNWTNWQAAFNAANSIATTPDFVIFLTDGQPTTYNGGGTGDNPTMYEAGTVAAIPSADALRSAVPGTNTVIGVGVGSGFTSVPGALDRLERVTDRAVAIPFDQLADTLAAEINRICAPSISVDKSVSPETLPEPGGSASFTATVENTSPTGADVQLTTLSDDVYSGFPGAATCKIDGVGDPVDPFAVWLAAGSTLECTWDASFSDKAPGWTETDTVSAQGQDVFGRQTNMPTATATVTITDVPSSITVDKVVQGTDSRPEPGGNFTFGITITNTSAVDSVTIDSIVDNPFGSLTDGVNPAITGSTCVVPQVLAPSGGAYSCSFSADVSGGPGAYPDTVTASGLDDDGAPVSDTGDASVTITNVVPTITVDKGADPSIIEAPGGDVTFTVIVTNTSSEAVEIISLEDDIYGALDGDDDCKVGTTLDPAGSCEFTFVGAVSGNPGDVHTNTVTVIAIDNEQTEAEASDDASVAIEPPPPGNPLQIDKKVGPQGTVAGSPAFVDPYTRPADETMVTWQITLTNDSEEPVYDVYLSDEASPSCETAFAAAVTAYEDGNIMEPGEVLVFTCDLEVGAAPFINTAEAGGFDKWGQEIDPVSDTATTLLVAASATIGDTVWSDENGNGVQDNGEKGIAGATVTLTLPDASTVSTTTNSNGNYLFSALPAGTYTVKLVMSSIPAPSEGSNKLTTPASFTIALADGQSVLTADFGVTAALPATGINSDVIALIGLVLMLIGGGALLATRRRRYLGKDDLAA